MKKIIALLALVILTASCKDKAPQKEFADKDGTESYNALFPKPKLPIKTVGILLYDGYSTLDAMGPYQVLGEMMGVDVFFVGRNRGLIADGTGMKVQCDTSIADVQKLDILVIPGGFKETYQATKDTTLLNWIKAIDAHSTYTTSVCTGSWILGATGVLKGKEATSHWFGKKILADEFGAKIKNERYVKSGKYWTSAGITAGMDMSLALVNDIMGENYTRVAMLDLEYDPQPPIKGGSEQNTDKHLVEIVRKMYDDGMASTLTPDANAKMVAIANTKDYLCGMPMPKTALETNTTTYKGKVYGFCSPTCAKMFEKDPAAFLSKK